MIYSDGVHFTTDGKLAELYAFAKSIDVPQNCQRINKWMISFELPDAGARERMRRTNQVTFVHTHAALKAKYQEGRAAKTNKSK